MIGFLQRSLQEHGQVELSALGVAISSLVTVAEILKSRGLAEEKKLATMLESTSSEDGRTRMKPKMEMTLVKTANFEEALEADNQQEAARKEAAAARAAANGTDEAAQAEA